MMKSLTFFALLIFSIGVSAQSKELKKALQSGARNEVYTATYDIPQDLAKVKSWCKENGFEVLRTKDGEIERFGDYVKGVIQVDFMEKNAYYAYQTRLRQQEAEQRKIAAQREAKADAEAKATLIGATIGLIAVIGAVAELGGSSSGEHSPQNKVSDNKRVEYKLGDWEGNSIFSSDVHDPEKIKIKFVCGGYHHTEYIGRDVSKTKPYSAGTNVCEFAGDTRFKTLEEAIKHTLDCKCK